MKECNVKTLFETIEMPVSQVLYLMECEGIRCDPQVLETLGDRASTMIDMLQIQIEQEAGIDYSINLNSPKQVQELLFDRLRLPTGKKSAGGEFSTRHSVLYELAKRHRVPALIMEYRELSKLKNTYIDALPAYINAKTGRIHTSYNQVAVATGRLSSTDPNLQNIPLNGREGLRVRSAFIPKEGNLFISADYSQIELRVLAYLSQDSALKEAFDENRDIHQETAARIFGVKHSEVTVEQRTVGKRINFSLLYGVTPYGLSRDLEIPFGQAKTYIDRYFQEYGGVRTWMDHIIEETKKNGYVETLWGRRRYIPAMYEKNQVLYQEACRVAINTVAQGTAAELMKIGMIKVQHALENQYPDAHILLQIHDELLISVPQVLAKEVEVQVKRILEAVVDWNVPLKITTRKGATWHEVTK